jgi:homoserine kinase
MPSFSAGGRVVSARDAVAVFAPATVANVASGFDVLGFAIEEPGDIVIARRTTGSGVRIVSVTGDGGRLPREPDRNTAGVAIRGVLDRIGGPFGVEVELHKRMPLSSGLGSSAASAVAGAHAANLLAGEPLERREMLPFVMEAERVACGSAHADNVAPCLLGGFVLIRSYHPLDVVRLPSPRGLAAAIVHPHIEVRTEDARRILKRDIRLSSAVEQWGNLAGLVASLFAGDLDLLSRCLKDVVAEPVRSLLIPGFATVKQAALDSGALGCSISGSGPSIFALCADEETARTAAREMSAAFGRAGLEADTFVSAVNAAGPREVSGQELTRAAGTGEG